MFDSYVDCSIGFSMASPTYETKSFRWSAALPIENVAH